MLQVKTFAEVEMSESAPAQLVDLGGRSVEVWQDEVEYKSDQTIGRINRNKLDEFLEIFQITKTSYNSVQCTI